MSLVSDLADKASSLLGTAAPAPQMKSAAASFKNAGSIEPPGENQPGAVAHNVVNVYDPKAPIEFIHFGRVHSDLHDRYHHANLDDTTQNALKDLQTGARAIMFRAALQREAILLDGFIAATQAVLKEVQGDEGGVAELAGAVTDLLSNGKGGSNPNDPAQLDPYRQAAQEAGGKANGAAVKYVDIHKAGLDLHQVRANYGEFAKELAKGEGGGGGGGGLFGNLPSALPIPELPGVGGIMKTVTGYLFKMYDIYKAMHFALREQYEPAIEEACYQRSLQAIRERYTPIFDVWSIPAKQATAANQGQQQKQPEEKLVNIGTGIDAVDHSLDGVNQAVSDARQRVSDTKQEITDTVDEAKRKWEEFWGTTPEPGPGETQLKAAFSAVSNPEQVIIGAFCKPLGMDAQDLPGFVNTAVTKLLAANLGMLQAVYVKLQDPQVAQRLDAEAFIAAGRVHLEGVVRGLLTDLLPSFSIGPGAGIVNKDMIAGKAADFADEQLGRQLQPIIEFCMRSLHATLTEAKTPAESAGALTMEVYLARLPLAIALTVRNTFFPIWQLIADKVFGTAGGVAGMMTSPIKKLMGEARDKVADAKKKAQELNADIKKQADDTRQDVKNAEQDIQNSIKDKTGGVASVGTPIGAAADSLTGAVGNAADSILGSATGSNADAGQGAGFPGSPRKKTGEGIEIKYNEWKEVNTTQGVHAS